MNISGLTKRAQQSKRGLRKLNFLLGLAVPFNKPHGIKLIEISNEKIKAVIPYKRRNFNHIKGIHACGLATVCEFVSGFYLLSKLGNNYRLIMQKLEVEYFYQAKKTAFAVFELSEEQFKNEIMQKLTEDKVVNFNAVVNCYDSLNEHLCTGTISWQLKSWDKVKTKP